MHQTTLPTIFPTSARDAALEYNPAIKDLPPQERPASRLTRLGPGALSTTECLAIILGTQHALTDANHLIADYGTLAALYKAGPRQLQQNAGIGPATATRITAALELGRRLTLEGPTDRFTVRSPADVAQMLMAELSHLDQEHFVEILLDTRNNVITTTTLYIGSLNSSQIRVGEVYKDPIRLNAAAIIIAHNHPSGDPSPSPEDVEVTRQIRAAGDLLDIELLDHLVIGKQRFISLRERGLGFS
jgi:DNA repair protein RadC